MIRFLTVLTVLSLAPQAAGTQIASDNMGIRAPLTHTTVLRQELNQKLVAIRQVALTLQASDGGSLSAEHRAAIQAKIDRAEWNYRRQLRRNDLMSVDANGSPVR
jgi:hypothetical protein